MALHEMWISFRLIAVLAVPLLGGLLAVVVPPGVVGVTAVGGAAFWYAAGVGVAIAVAGGMAAGTLASERRRGTVAWMAVRAVPRSAVLFSWFVAYGLILAAGIVVGSIGAWLAAVSRAEATPDALPYAAGVVATIGTGLAVVALALLVGTLLRTLPAMVLATVAGALLLAAALLLAPGGIPSPTGGISLLAHLDTVSRPVAEALRSTGLALITTAVLLALGVIGIERADL